MNNSCKHNLPVMFLKTIVILSGVMVVFGCKHTAESPATPPPAVVSFQNDIVPLFNATCSLSNCHSGSSPTGNLNLEANVAYYNLFLRSEIDTVHPELSSLYIKLNSVSPTMPPSGRLIDAKINLVFNWIKQGARNN